MQRSLTVKDKMQTSNNIFSTFLPFSFTTACARTLSTGKSGERARPNKKCCSLLEQYHRMGSPRSSQEFFRAHTHINTQMCAHIPSLSDTRTHTVTRSHLPHTLCFPASPFFSPPRAEAKRLYCAFHQTVFRLYNFTAHSFQVHHGNHGTVTFLH